MDYVKGKGYYVGCIGGNNMSTINFIAIVLRDEYKEGDRVKLVSMKGENIPSGICGTVKYVDDIGQIHVHWDNGSTLALNINDCWKRVKVGVKNETDF